MNDKIKRPVLIPIFVLIVALKVCALLFLVFMAIFATPDSTFQLTGDRMRVGDVRAELLVTLVLWLILTTYVGLGLWRGNSIARHLFFGLVVVVLLGETIARQRFIELPIVISVSGLVAWYLYAKPSVKLFFNAT